MSEKNRKPSQKSQRARQARRAQLRRKRRIKRIAWRCALSVLTLIAVVLVAVLVAGNVGFRGPSQTMGDLLTVSMLETSALKFVPRLYYSKDHVQEIVDRNSIGEMEEEINTSLIVIAPPTPEPTPTPDPASMPEETPVPTPTVPTTSLQPVADEDGIQIYEVKGSTYHGYMTVVQDPSRVTVGTCRDSFNKSEGLELYKLAKRYDAVAAINGGAFADTNGLGNGGQPGGLVVSEGQLKHNANLESSHNLVIGFTEDDILVFGKWSTEEAHQWKLRDAVSFGPALVYNGEALDAKGISSGLNPRSAIGQRADGAVLMLIIEGRQANSLGATYADLIKLMLDFGAVNAANLDGGSSSMLYYKGEYLTNGVVLTGSRKMPTAFIVR